MHTHLLDLRCVCTHIGVGLQSRAKPPVDLGVRAPELFGPAQEECVLLCILIRALVRARIVVVVV